MILCGVKEDLLFIARHIYSIIVALSIKLIVALMDKEVLSVCLTEYWTCGINIACFYNFVYTFVYKWSCTCVFNKLVIVEFYLFWEPVLCQFSK